MFCWSDCCFVLATPLSGTRGWPACRGGRQVVSLGRWIWAHPRSTIASSPRFPVRSPFLLLPSSSAAALHRAWYWTEISSISHFVENFVRNAATSEALSGVRTCPTYGMLPRTSSHPPPRHEHLHQPMHVWRPLKAEESVGEGQPGERSVEFVPYPLGSCLFLTPMRGVAGEHGFTLEHVGPRGGGERHWCVPARQPSGHSNRGPRTLHPEPVGLRPLAIQWSG